MRQTCLLHASLGTFDLYARSNVAPGGEVALGALWLQVAATYKCFSGGSGDSLLFFPPHHWWRPLLKYPWSLTVLDCLSLPLWAGVWGVGGGVAG